jgi:hypothetical protein
MSELVDESSIRRVTNLLDMFGVKAAFGEVLQLDKLDRRRAASFSQHPNSHIK